MTDKEVSMTNDSSPNLAPGATGSAVRDVQERLHSIGYDLGEELATGSFGELTAFAVASFKRTAGLGGGSEVDHQTWTTLVDASFTLGDRLLYLRMPYFHGQDVRNLQTALAVMGFSCSTDGIFGAHTEMAVREFQHNAGIGSDGIVGDSTFSAINRLRHAWEGKDILRSESKPLGFARAAEVLESRVICLLGTDTFTKNVAKRISNLALATTVSSLVEHVQKPKDFLQPNALLIKLTRSVTLEEEQDLIPVVVYDNDSSLGARMATAIGLTSAASPRIITQIALVGDSQGKPSARHEQHIAIAILDAICLALDQG